MKKTRNLLLIAVLLSLFLAACNIAGPAEDACVSSSSLFEDNFEGETDCGWVLYNQSGSVVAIEEGSMRLSTSQPGQIWWTNPRRNFDDTVITVQARQADGPNDNAYGVVCRYQDPQNFYIFLVSGDGFYSIGKYVSNSNQVVYLTPDGQYQFSDIINQGVATNQLRVSCIGNELSLSVNGIPLMTVQDSSFPSGDIGLGVSTLAPGTAVVEFDNLRVIAP
ncbi:MAG: hypothetical protein AAF614_04895 [Chloroflexota bacterium]